MRHAEISVKVQAEGSANRDCAIFSGESDVVNSNNDDVVNVWHLCVAVQSVGNGGTLFY
jgi:hypothetical protein